MKKYVIQKGDSFSSLAQRFGIKNGDILRTYHNLHCPEEDIMQEPIAGKEIIIPEDPKLMTEENNVPSSSSAAYKEGEITETQTHEKSSSEEPSSEIDPSEQKEKKDEKKEENEEGSSNPHEGKYFVIQKGMCQCNQGFKFPKFKVTSHQKHYWNDADGQADYLAVTEDDLTFDPVAMPFGNCKLRPSLGGYLPCAYSPSGKWQKTYEKVKVMGKSCVTEISELMCSTGGKITILKHGQQSEIGKSHVRNADSREQQIYNPVVNFDAFKAEIEENESESSVQPQKDETSPKEKEILEVRLTFDDGTPVNKKLSYRDRLWATAKCHRLEGEHIIFTLWEDDEKGGGHNTKNQSIIKSPPIEVDSMGYARWNFTLLNTFIKLANLREDDKKQHEYYVTAEYNGKIRASDNANANNPEYHISITSKSNTRKSRPQNSPQPQPQPDSAKGSTHQGSKNNQPDTKGIITKVRLTDKNGKEFTKRPKFGERIKILIEGKELVGKSYQLKIWEHDIIGSNDLLYSNRHTFGGNRQQVLITLTNAMQKTGEIGSNKKNPDIGEYWWKSHQEIFAEVIFLYKSARSQVINVDLNTEPQKPKNVASTSNVGKSQETQKKTHCICQEQYKDLVWGGKVSCEFRRKVVQIAKNLGLPQNNYEGANWLMTVMALETAHTFSPKCGTFGKNPDESSKYKYVGLIQFGKIAADEIQTTRTYLMSLTAEQQLDYVEKHFKKKQFKNLLKNRTALYLAINYPNATIHATEKDYVVYDSSKAAYDDNPIFKRESHEFWIDKKGKKQYYEGKEGKSYVWEFEEALKEVEELGKANKAKIFTCSNSESNNVNAKGIVTYHIYASGKIEKHIPKNINEKYKDVYKYVYHDSKGNKHEVCNANWHKTKEKGVGQVYKNKPTHSKVVFDHSVSEGNTSRRVKYENGDIAEYGRHPTKGIIWLLYKAGNKDIELVKMPDSLNYNKDGIQIAYNFADTKRRYTGADAFAGFIGFLAKSGYKLTTTGSCFSEGSSFPSQEHCNGRSVDIVYLGVTEKDQKVIDSAVFFHFTEVLKGINDYCKKLARAGNGGTLHNGHLHAGNFNGNVIKIIKE